MRVLLDTQALLALLGGGGPLSARAHEAIFDPRAQAVVSAASVWEVAIKAAIGKLDAPHDLPALLETHPAVDLRPVSAEVAWGTRELPLIHRDPFDRLIIAQARADSLPVVTGDAVFARYGVGIIW